MIVKVISKIKIENRNHLIHMTNTGMSLGLTEMFHKAWYSSGFFILNNVVKYFCIRYLYISEFYLKSLENNYILWLL